MKKMLIFFLIILFPIFSKAISAESAVVFDSDSGRVLYCKSCDRSKLIASTTKIMTAIVAIENGDLKQEVEVSEAVLASYGSNIYIEVGEVLTLEDLIYGLLLRSGNDAAIMIAETISGSMSNFAHIMNKKAKEIGMKNTIFYNAHGLEEKNKVGNKSTAYDMALLTQYATKNENFKKIFGTKKHVTKSTNKTYVWNNKNRLLTTYEYTTGGKTGFTELAKRTLVTTATKDNKNLIVVTLNGPNDFSDHKSLYETYFVKYNLLTVLKKADFKVKKDTFYLKDKLEIKNDFKMLVTKEEAEDVRTEVVLEKLSFYKDDQRVGTVKVYIDEELIHEEGIYVRKNANENKTKGNIFQRIWDFIKFWD